MEPTSGSRTANDYQRAAANFYQQAVDEKLPSKISGDTMRIYDPTTNTFGSYDTTNGNIKTFYKPSRGAAYWADQPGILGAGPAQAAAAQAAVMQGETGIIETEEEEGGEGEP